MPAELLEDPAGISCVFSDGRRCRRTVAAEPGELVRDLLEGLASMIHPHGSIDARSTVGNYTAAVSDMARFMRERGARGGIGRLSRGLLAEYWMQAGRFRESATRRMVVSFDAARGGGALQAGVRELAAGRHFAARPSSSPLVPYTPEEWERLHEACRQTADEAFARHRQALKSAARGQDPRDGGWTVGNQRWLLMRLGPMSDERAGAHLGVSGTWVGRRGGMRSAGDELFPNVNVVIAYRLLLGIYTGIVPDGVAGLGIGDIDWAGDAAVLLSYVKGRTAAESRTLQRRAVRLLEQWLEHSAPVREHAPSALRGSLWLYYAYSGSGKHWQTAPDSSTQERWARQCGVSVDRRRIRTTYLSLRDRSRWHGSSRSAIDPNHTPAVEGDHYLTAATPAQREALDTIIEDAQHDLLSRSHPPVVLADEDAAELAESYPGLVAGLNLDDTVIAGLMSGEQDVFVAACADPLSGLHGPPGKPCPARPWVCLLCPLAVFTPRHAANLLRLKTFFARQWNQMPSAQFMAVFGPYSTRITQILERYPAPLLAAAAAEAGDASDQQIPLRPEERTT
jgi:integrase